VRGFGIIFRMFRFALSLIFLFPLSLYAEKIYLSCDLREVAHLTMHEEKKKWLLVDKDEKRFVIFSEDSIKTMEDRGGAEVRDLEESPQKYNGLDRTTLIYQSEKWAYDCKVVSEMKLAQETQAFLDNFLKNREI